MTHVEAIKAALAQELCRQDMDRDIPSIFPDSPPWCVPDWNAVNKLAVAVAKALGLQDTP